MTDNIAEPKCPDCRVQGLQFIVSSESKQASKGGDAWFEVVHCSQCGHTYGVFAKVVLSPSPIRTPPFNF
ncbi:hypothetical protein N5I05_04480 [Acinetobacter johnsonii]|uniref:hypothetical protein n=1 Tax=Acinetobacter johnsonii TaxID=40214 RepID=UPI002446EB99|nr:hypothetical protein [Acinetobacter johnsonii]MDH1697809.1 hypothetical protein [Acinetobacter johnsonii]